MKRSIQSTNIMLQFVIRVYNYFRNWTSLILMIERWILFVHLLKSIAATLRNSYLCCLPPVTASVSEFDEIHLVKHRHRHCSATFFIMPTLVPWLENKLLFTRDWNQSPTVKPDQNNVLRGLYWGFPPILRLVLARPVRHSVGAHIGEAGRHHSGGIMEARDYNEIEGVKPPTWFPIWRITTNQVDLVLRNWPRKRIYLRAWK